MAIKQTIKATEDIEIKDKQVVEEDIIDVELKQPDKKKFRLDRDDSRVIELNTSDLGVIGRLEEIYPKMLKFVHEAQDKYMSKAEGSSEDDIDVSGAIDYINTEMKKLLNWAFDSDIADKACPSGTLYDPINGKFRFEYIMEKLVGLYGNNLRGEFAMMQKRIDKHTAKYTKKRK